MPLSDLPLAELERYRPDVREPADFAASWADTCAGARAFAPDLDVSPVGNRLALVDTRDVTSAGFDGPPSTVFAACHHDGSMEKEIAVYPFNGHAGGDAAHVQRQLDRMSATMPSPLRAASTV